jgi:hypothetical protein
LLEELGRFTGERWEQEDDITLPYPTTFNGSQLNARDHAYQAL